MWKFLFLGRAVDSTLLCPVSAIASQSSQPTQDTMVKYVGEEHAMHLQSAIQEDYEVKSEWDGRRYIGITLDWDYNRRQVHLSMPGYVAKALKQFQHEAKRQQHQPFPSKAIRYGAKK